ncbi:MAG: flap endonuclease [Micromonosporaceae bacterium]|nr:flap endonuclease [Micromonosporaceae bacterium]
MVDGNSLTHRAYHAGSAYQPGSPAPAAPGLAGAGPPRTPPAVGRPTDQAPVWALRGLIGYIARAAAKLRPDALLIGFDCPDESRRKAEYPGYKAHRPDKPDDLAEQIRAAPGLLAEAGLTTIVARAHEADDVLASAAAHARRCGWRTVVMTSDRDAFALIDESTSVLRVRNGGIDEAVLVTPQALLEVYGVHPWQYVDYAALRGDPSDNLPGVRGFGSATAARLLAAFGTVEAAWTALDTGAAASVRSVVGEAAAQTLASPEARAIVARNRSLMRLRADLPVPNPDDVRLPVDRFVMRRAFAERGIYLGPSLWALTGGSPPPTPEALAQVAQPWVWRRSPRARRDPAPGQLALF